MSSPILYLIVLLLSPLPHVPFTSAAPLVPRIPTTTQPLDPSTDEWSSTLSSISPLILLIGERTTKQVLRNVRSPSQAFSLASAPLGLLSIVTCLIRFCGIKELRAWIGYELEARNVVGMEVCRVNCGGVSAHLSGGWVVRSTVGEPASRLIGVGILEGKEMDVVKKAAARIWACEEFERERVRRGIPDGVVGVAWVMHLTSKDASKRTLGLVFTALAEAVGIPEHVEQAVEFRRHLESRFSTENPNNPVEDAILELQHRNDGAMNWNNEVKGDPKKSVEVSSVEVTPTTSDLKNVEKSSLHSPIKFTLMSTFDAVSEFTTSTAMSNTSSIGIGVLSMIGILTIHILELWTEKWIVTIGWILMMVGYVGIVCSVTFAAILIHQSCICMKLDTRSTGETGQWQEGMVVSVKNTDSMDTTGSNFVTSSSKQQDLEAVWIKPSTRHEKLLASGVAMLLVLAFVSHYLGLRAMKWWASVGELCICLLASFARSFSNDHQRRFKVAEGIKIDKRCMSTGVIRTQTARLITDQTGEKSRTLDARAYSRQIYNQQPTTGERIAFRTAKLILKDPQLHGHLTKLTGMTVTVGRAAPHQRAILASFSGGILLVEGVGFPEAILCQAFQSTSSDLASPTGLLARSIMRQPEWRLTHPGFGKGIPFGNVYIFSIQSMMDWWTLSEDRNDMGDLQRNLVWPMFLVNVAFFVELLKTGDQEMIEEIEKAHVEDENEMKSAQNVVDFLMTAF
jgi:hypothetical protein